MHVESYNSMDEAFAAMAEAEQRANDSLHPEQIALRDRSEETVHWVRPYETFLIFGETPSVADSVAIERTYYPADPMPEEDQQEFDSIQERLVEGRKRGYLNGRCYSTIEPDGEIGNTHVAAVWPISKQSFEEAKAGNWQPAPENAPALVQDLDRLFSLMRRR